MIVAGIPAYNEEKTIAKVILLAQRHVDAVVVCDDGSNDLTSDIARKLGAIVIRHEKNLGYGAAIKEIFQKARDLNADLLLTLDADGQHDSQEIPKLISPILEDKADIVIGSRFLQRNTKMPLYRRLGIKALTKMTGRERALFNLYIPGAMLLLGGIILGLWALQKAVQTALDTTVALAALGSVAWGLAGAYTILTAIGLSGKGSALTDAQCGFRAYSRKAIKDLALEEQGMGISAEILLKARDSGLMVVEVPVQVNYKGLETSTHNPFQHGLDVLVAMLITVLEERPLFYLGIPGVVFLLGGIIFGLWTLQIYTVYRYVETNIALASIAFGLIGVFTTFTAITLYALVRLARKLSIRDASRNVGN